MERKKCKISKQRRFLKNMISLERERQRDRKRQWEGEGKRRYGDKIRKLMGT